MNDNYKLYIEVSEFQQKVLDYITSGEIDKMINATIFANKTDCKRAIIHGMAIASMLTSRCKLIGIKDDE